MDEKQRKMKVKIKRETKELKRRKYNEICVIYDKKWYKRSGNKTIGGQSQNSEGNKYSQYFFHGVFVTEQFLRFKSICIHPTLQSKASINSSAIWDTISHC